MTGPDGMLAALSPEHRGRLLELGHEVVFPPMADVFEEDGPAESFWLLRAGRVALDVHIPGGGPAVVETLGPGELLGWSWLFPPFRWHLGARTRTTVEAYEFSARAVREAMAADPQFGLAVTTQVAETIGERLRASRVRLLDLYGPTRRPEDIEREASP